MKKIAALMLVGTLACPPAWAGKCWPWTNDHVANNMADFAAKLNSRTPYFANGLGITTAYGPVAVEAVKAKGRQIFYRLRFLAPIPQDRDMRQAVQLSIVHSTADDSVCNNPVIISMLREDQAMIFSYYDSTGEEIMTASINPTGCGVVARRDC